MIKRKSSRSSKPLALCSHRPMVLTINGSQCPMIITRVLIDSKDRSSNQDKDLHKDKPQKRLKISLSKRCKIMMKKKKNEKLD